jgi:hypothetical protein
MSKIEEMFWTYFNGNKKDFVALVDEYGLYSVWDDMHSFLTEREGTLIEGPDTWIRKMVISYHYIKYR